MSADDERLGPPIKPKSGEEVDGTEFPKSVVLDDGTEVPVGLPPGVDPEHAKLALEYLKQNPALAKNAVRHADKLVKNPGMKNELAQMQSMMSSEEYRTKMAVLREDPELKPIFDEIAGNGMEAIDKYWNDMDVMSKISKRLEEMNLQPKSKKPPVKINNLHDAAKAGDIEALKKFVEQGDDVNKADARGITPLGVAVGFNRIEAVQYLLKNGADVKLTDKKGNTVLHYAAGYGRLEVAEMLLAADADPSCVNSDDQTPLDAAKINRESVMIEFLTKRLKPDHQEK